MTGEGPLLVLGVGNTLLCDEGVGVHLQRRLAEFPELLPPNTDVVDGGTLGLELLPMVSDARALVLLDAANLQALPGTVRVLQGAEVQGVFGGHVSPHQAGAGDLIAVAALTGGLPGAVAMVGVQPAEVRFDLDLSAAVAGAMDAAVDAARAVAWELHRKVQDHA